MGARLRTRLSSATLAGCAVLAVVAVGFAGGARAETYVLLPARGDAFRPVLRAIDDEARRALLKAGLDVEAQSVTDRQLSDLSSSGINCDVSTDDCALRIALTAGVDVIVTESVSVLGSRLLLRVSAVPAAAGARPRHVFGELVLPNQDQGASVASAVLRAVGKTADPTPVPLPVTLAPDNALVVVDGHAAAVEDGRLWVTPGAHHVEVRAPGHKTLALDVTLAADAPAAPVAWTLAAPTAPDKLVADANPPASSAASTAGRVDEGPGLPPGAIVAGAGAGVVVLGAALAGVSELWLGGAMPFGQRQAVQLFGQGALVVGAVGAVAAVGGGIWLAVE